MSYDDNHNVSPSFLKYVNGQNPHGSVCVLTFLAGGAPRGSHKDDRNANKSTFPSFVIQKYMERPMLYKAHKFDIRAFGLLTQDMTLYVFS